MAIEDKRLDLAQSMNFGTQLRQKLDQPPPLADESDDAMALEGVPTDLVVADTRQDFITHSLDNGNPHNVVLDVAPKNIIDVELNKLLDEGVLPISRFGSLNYLPINVGGISEGSIEVSQHGSPCCIEKDGTLTYLRIALSAGKRDLFYAYIESLTSISDNVLPHPIYSTRKYRPPGFPVDGEVFGMFAAYNGLVSGTIIYPNNTTTHFVAVTNGTLDDTQHTLYGMSLTGLEYGLRETISIYRHNHPTLGDRLFLIENTPFPGTIAANAFKLYMSSSPLSMLSPGDSISWVQVSANWSVTKIDGSVASQSDGKMRFSDFRKTDDPEVSAMVLTHNGIASEVFRANSTVIPFVHPSNGTVRFLFVDTANFTLGNLSKLVTLGFSCTVNPATHEASIDSQDWPVEVDLNSGATEIVVTNADSATGALINTFYTQNNTIGVVPYGDRIITIRGTQAGNNTQPKITNAKLLPGTSFTNTFNAVAFNGTNNSGDLREVQTLPRLNGAVGNEMRSITMLNNKYAVVSCSGVTEAGVLETASSNNSLAFMRTDIDSFPTNYLIDQDRSVTLPGVLPEVPRRRLSDMGLDYNEFTKLIQVTKLDNSVRAIGGWLVAGYRNSVPMRITISNDVDPMDKVPVISLGRIKCTDAVMNAAKNTIVTTEGFSANHRSSGIELCYLNPTEVGEALPAFLVVTLTTTTNTGYTFLYRATVTTVVNGNDIDITGITVGSRLVSTSPVFNVPTDDRGLVTVRNTVGLVRAGCIVVHEFSDCFFIAGCSLLQFGTSQTANPYVGHRFRMKWDKASTGDYSLAVATASNNYSQINYYWSCPGVGAGEVQGSASGYIDVGTKVVFRPCAVNRNDILTWGPSKYPITSAKVVASSREPNSFIVDFPDTQPVLILGTLHELPPTRINLTDIVADPTNKTFYVFVELDGDGVKYVVEDAARVDTADSIYIGKLMTDANSISSIQLEKVTKIAEYRLSTAARGLAIPVSLGAVEEEGHLHNYWLNPPTGDISNLIVNDELNGLQPV